MIAYCIGNGPSRKNFQLQRLINGQTYGCNALHRDFLPDHLFCLDREIATELDEQKIQYKCKVYAPIHEVERRKGFNLIPSFEKLPLSGDQCVKTAYVNGCRHIILIGYDYMEYGENKLNNIYQGTRSYGVRITKEEFSKSIKWFLNFVKEKQDCKFTIVHDSISEKILSANLNNLNIISYKEFEDSL